MTAVPATGEKTPKRRKRAPSTIEKGESRVAWAFSAPALILLLAFIVLPFVLAFVLSFTNQRLISPLPTRFVGIDNYVDTLSSATFWKAFFNNVWFVVIVVPLQTAFALWLAILVNRKIPGRVFFRTVFFLPVVTVMAAAAVIWTLLFNANGLVNAIMETITFGAFSPDWLNSTTWALPAMMLVGIWQGVGFQMVILLAALQDVPEVLYEAASIDGASRWQQFMNVTLPGIRSAQRFRQARNLKEGEAYPYLTVYDIETDDIDAVLASLTEARLSAEEEVAGAQGLVEPGRQLLRAGQHPRLAAHGVPPGLPREARAVRHGSIEEQRMLPAEVQAEPRAHLLLHLVDGARAHGPPGLAFLAVVGRLDTRSARRAARAALAERLPRRSPGVAGVPARPRCRSRRTSAFRPRRRPSPGIRSACPARPGRARCRSPGRTWRHRP